jgi:endonuclease III
MKNATKHAEELRALVKKLSREHKPEPRPTLEPLKALVRGSMSYDASDTKADEAMEVIAREFVDLNELRVATELEVQDMVGQRFPGIEKRVAMVTAILNAIFEKEHTLSLDRFKTLSKKDARAALRALADDVHPFVEAYTMLFGFDAHAVPVDDMMLNYLKEHGVVEPTTTLEDAQKFLEHAVKGEEHYDVFYVLRRAALAAADGAAKKKK